MAVQAARSDELSRRKKTKSTTGSVAGDHDAGKYRAKKAGGDVKRKGQHDPFSYVPLRKDMLNKRFVFLLVSYKLREFGLGVALALPCYSLQLG